MDPMNIDMTAGPVAAFASTHRDGADRWTQLEVRHLHTLNRCWVAEVRGVSTLNGERDKVRRIASASLERALHIFDDSDLGRMVKAQAREYAEEQGLATVPKQSLPAADRDAIAWLYGCEPADLLLAPAARALGTSESTMRAAMLDGRPIKVALRSILPFVDRAAFRAAHVKENVDAQ